MSELYTSYMYSGAAFDFSNPQPSTVFLSDIARGLDEKRFKNQLETPWSVLQHSLLTVVLIGTKNPEICLETLFHDASEAYTGDIPGPFKKLLGESIKKYERLVEQAIADKFGLVYPWNPIIKQIDILAQDIEAYMLHPHGHRITRPGFKLTVSQKKAVEKIQKCGEKDFLSLAEDLLEQRHGVANNKVSSENNPFSI